MSRSDPSFTGCQGRGLILRLRSRYWGHVCRSGEVADPEGVLLLLLLAQGTQAQDDGPLAWLLLLAGQTIVTGHHPLRGAEVRRFWNGALAAI